MTLLVGVWCQDGAVFAADKQTSHGTAGAMTVGHPTTKIVPIKNKALFASSGHRGLGQQLCAALLTRVDKFDGQPVAAAAKDIQDDFRKMPVRLTRWRSVLRHLSVSRRQAAT